ncbi:hypothetical protein [Teredinibacter sp. KSP-S5-2]|uniref:hypothetical protein n=1 Tax=Teredinibacter sp. KSP-S5-2 TaxID=3034506 RepID=UPI002934D4C6|nr:hypothetical protein [Teredinibacter sp. KSP-S5-2]WNO08440.1 hypothetical protein P5V12_15830 [Teredinibacter sp. KSP-S5-2]
MKNPIFLIIFATLQAGCSVINAGIQIPATIVAIVSNPKPTGWWRDYCQDGILVPHQPECVQTGGIINRARLSNIRTLEGKSIPGTLIIGFPGHLYEQGYKQEIEIQLKAAPLEFRRATGIEFLASDWKNSKQVVLHSPL